MAHLLQYSQKSVPLFSTHNTKPSDGDLLKSESKDYTPVKPSTPGFARPGKLPINEFSIS
jgi:hypothetical protein